MKLLPVVLAAAALAPNPARSDCMHDIAVTSARAELLAPSKGKAALQEQIQRADIARHEGDEEECAQDLSIAIEVLDKLDAANRPSGSAK